MAVDGDVGFWVRFLGGVMLIREGERFQVGVHARVRRD
jgi:hypothetical protein